MSSNQVSLRVLTYNLWGIFNSKMKEQRMIHFASKIEHYDVILLQEQFEEVDFDLIKERVQPNVRKQYHFRRFPSGFYGSGCAVISRYPIRSSFFYIYPLQGYPEMLLHGDFFANKGVARIVIDVPTGDARTAQDDVIATQPVIFYTTHLVAVYQKTRQLKTWKDERYLTFRLSQAISLANFIISTSNPTDHIIIGGDFNSSQRSLEMHTMLIILKSKGYQMRSALPTPCAKPVLAQATYESPSGESHFFFTYSYSNAFNSSKMSYFKLLNMESDIPSQIDHILFSSNTFHLASFESCPDVAEEFPFYTEVEGKRVPNGVVVFTKEEVRRLPKALPLRWLFTAGKCLYDYCFRTCKSIHKGDTQVNHEGGGEGQPTSFFNTEEREGFLYPISDHFGVAARLNFFVGGSDNAAVYSAMPQSVPLTEEDRKVIVTVLHSMKSQVNKLRGQVKVMRYLSFVSVAVIFFNFIILMRAASAQQARIVHVLQKLHFPEASHALSANAAETAASRAVTKDALAASASSKVFQLTPAGSTNRLFGWVGAVLKAVGLSGDDMLLQTQHVHDDYQVDSGNTSGKPLNSSGFHFLARQLVQHPFWYKVTTCSLINIGAALMGACTICVGTLHRSGNANLLDDQMNTMMLALLEEDSGEGAENKVLLRHASQ